MHSSFATPHHSFVKPAFALGLLLLIACPVHPQANEAVVSDVAVLTIHVRDTNIHDVVFHFLTDVLRLPTDYGPVMMGERRYAAVYAGNLFIEPCGPYTNMRYPVRDFKALFFGLNCRSDKTAPAIAAHLDGLKLPYGKPGPGVFRVQDTSIGEGIYFAIDTQPRTKADEEKEASLASAFAANQRGGPGLEYVKEIWLGYAEPAQLEAWREFLGPSAETDATIWKLTKSQSIRFVNSEIRGVRGIVFKVRSMEAAGRFLRERKCDWRLVNGRMELDKANTLGLTILVTDE